MSSSKKSESHNFMYTPQGAPGYLAASSSIGSMQTQTSPQGIIFWTISFEKKIDIFFVIFFI